MGTVRWMLSVLVAVLLWLGVGAPVRAIAPWGNALAIASPANQSMMTEVRVHLGNENEELVFVPNHFEFSAGKRYKLILDNPSSQKHYFTAKDFADAVWTQKVEAGKVEIKGAIHELELKPGAVAEWVFVPLKPGRYTLRCIIPGHTEAGMKGTIEIKL
jgi:uncharacterized cupredoxin-like copper-binding protein